MSNNSSGTNARISSGINIVETLLNTASIEEVIGDRIQITKKGSDYKAICPFHNDTSPSLSISVKKQIYKCFSCGAGGNIFKFVQEYDKVSFPEALKILANKYNISLKIHDKNHEKYQQQQQQQLKIKSINQKVLEIFKNYLIFCYEKNKPIKNYLEQRKISKEMIEKFEIGCTLPKGQLTKLLQKKYSSKDLLTAGILRGENNNSYEFFIERLIFPIKNERNETIGFGGRTLNNHQAKYINSAENFVFKKRNILYGLNYITTLVNQQKKIYITEGYLDAIACQFISNLPAVAPLGTALTEEHVKKIKRYVNEAILIFDGDEAGKKAAIKSCQLLLQYELNGKVVLLPNGNDPFDLLTNEVEKFNQLLKQQVSLENYIFDFYNIHKDLSSSEKNNKISEVLNIFNNIENKIIKEDLIKKLSEKIGVSIEGIQQQSKKNYFPKKTFVQKKIIPPDFFYKELEILILLIFYPSEIDYVKAEFLISLDFFSATVTKHIYQKLLSLKNSPSRKTIIKKIYILFEENPQISNLLSEKVNQQQEQEQQNILIGILKEHQKENREFLLSFILKVFEGETTKEDINKNLTQKNNLNTNELENNQLQDNQLKKKIERKQIKQIEKKINLFLKNIRNEILTKIFSYKKKTLDKEIQWIKEEIYSKEQQGQIEKIPFLQENLQKKIIEIQKLNDYLRKIN